ncbi:hypothetical protein GCM10010193_06720 [Kitasatospora atroaurantiaca]
MPSLMTCTVRPVASWSQTAVTFSRGSRSGSDVGDADEWVIKNVAVKQPSPALIGFTGATGDLNDKHSVTKCDIYY